jgi:hypothetical protein
MLLTVSRPALAKPDNFGFGCLRSVNNKNDEKSLVTADV